MAKWDCEIGGVSYHLEYDEESGEILCGPENWHGEEPRSHHVARAVEEHFRDWWAESMEARGA